MEKIAAEKRTYSSTPDTHFHYYGQLILPLQGQLSIQTGVNDFQLNHETLLYIPPNCTHTFHSMTSNEFLILEIPDFMLTRRELQEEGNLCKFNNHWKGIRFLIQNEMEQKNVNTSALKQLYPYISYYLLQDCLPKSIQYIHDHYHEKITIQKLASLEHYHPTYYSEWFYKKTEKTPFTYIQEVRLNKAKELLCHTNLSILHIALQVGLEYQSSLTRLFQKYEGITPTQFRKQCISDK